MPTATLIEHAYFVKDPRATVHVDIDWTEWLAAESAAIVTSVWVPPAGLTTATPTVNGGVVRIFVSGGVAGQSYVLRNTITTNNGLTDSRSLRVQVRDR